MAVAGLMLPALTGSSGPNRTRRSLSAGMYHISHDEVVKIKDMEAVDQALELTQQRYVFRQVRRCLKPFRLFLSFIGRFPFYVREDGNQPDVSKAFVKYGLTLSLNQHPEGFDEFYSFTYRPLSPKGIWYFFTTFATSSVIGNSTYCRPINANYTYLLSFEFVGVFGPTLGCSDVTSC